MKLDIAQQAIHKQEKTAKKKKEKVFPSLDQEKRTSIPTDNAAYHLFRKDQTLRGWACHENGPIKPVRINGRLAWPVARIKELLNGVIHNG